MYDPFGSFSLLEQTSSSASSSLNIYDPLGGLSLLEQTSSSASSSFNIYDPFDCFSSSLDQATNHINGQLYDDLGCDSSSSCLDATTSIVSSQFDGQYSNISPVSSLGHHHQNQNNYSSMISDTLDMGNVIYNNNNNDNFQNQINLSQHCHGNNISNNVIYHHDINNSLNINNINNNSSSINQQLQNYQHQLNHKLQTNTGSGASKRSVLMNLLIDGSDVGAGYTSHNCRALPQIPRSNQLRL